LYFHTNSTHMCNSQNIADNVPNSAVWGAECQI
jgi:hypothetical protein